MTGVSARRVARFAAVALLGVLALAAAIGGCARDEGRARVEIAADYVRATVNADYGALAKIVAEDARPFAQALVGASAPEGTIVTLGDEKWDGDTLTMEIGFGEPSAYLKLSPPDPNDPDDVIAESWNDAGAEAGGTITVAYEDDRLVVTAIDGEPIADVLARGRSLW